MQRKQALKIGWLSIAAALCVQLFNDLACYERGLIESITTIWFPAIPLVPAIIALIGENPLQAVGASVVAAGFYALAYVTDCVLPYEGGGASMIYVVVILYGTPLAFLGAWIAGKLFREAGITVVKR